MVSDDSKEEPAFVKKTTNWNLNFARPELFDANQVTQIISGKDKEKVAGSLMKKKKKKKGPDTKGKPLNLFCHYRDTINMMYIDLPGLLYGKSAEDAETAKEREELVEAECAPPNRFIVFVHSAIDEDDEAVRLLRKKIDPGRHRSVLVYTRFIEKVSTFTNTDSEVRSGLTL